MALTGLSLGTVMSIKYVGVFTVVFVGLHTVYQLFHILLDPKQTLVRYVIYLIMGKL